MIKKIVLIILVIMWAGLIFYFSSQGKTTSNEVSKEITEKIVDLTPIINNLPPEKKQPLVGKANTNVRKSAHFSLFLVFGILVLLLVKCYNSKGLSSFIVALLICLLYAISDEIHQIFVIGRGNQWQDVLLDFSGSFLGCSIVLGVLKYNTLKANIKPSF